MAPEAAHPSLDMQGQPLSLGWPDAAQPRGSHSHHPPTVLTGVRGKDQGIQSAFGGGWEGAGLPGTHLNE